MILRSISFFVLLMMLGFTASAQLSGSGKMRFGLRGGLSAANLLLVEGPNKYAGFCPDGGCMLNERPENYTFNYEGGPGNTRFGFVAGLFAERRLSNRFAVEVGLNYEQKGLNLNYTAYTSETHGGYQFEKWQYFKRAIRNDYVVLPLVATYKLSPASHYYLTCGIYASFLVNAAGTAEDSVINKATAGQEVMSRRMNRMEQAATKKLTSAFDAGLIAGAGASWPLGNSLALTLDARLNVGLLKVDRKYNNKFEEKPLPPGTGHSAIVISESYYRGLNSQARNINLNLTAGISRSF